MINNVAVARTRKGMYMVDEGGCVGVRGFLATVTKMVNRAP